MVKMSGITGCLAWCRNDSGTGLMAERKHPISRGQSQPATHLLGFGRRKSVCVSTAE